MTNLNECTHARTETLSNEEGTCEWTECLLCGEVLSSWEVDPDYEEYLSMRTMCTCGEVLEPGCDMCPACGAGDGPSLEEV